MLSCFVCFVGMIIVLRLLRDIVYTLWILFVAKPLDLSSIYGKDSYVIITGGSKGIGFGLARQFAKQNFNLVLISRNKQDLARAQRDLEELNPTIKVITRSFDFNALGRPKEDHDMWSLLDLPEDLDYSVLVNNVGMLNKVRLESLDEEQIKRVITVNCTSQALMSRMMISRFKERASRSCVLTVSSIANKYPFPGMTLYGATKYFNRFFALNTLDDRSIDQYVYSPGFVETDMVKGRQTVLMVSVEQSTSSAFKFLGRSLLEFHGHWKHEMRQLKYRLCPDWLLDRIVQ